MVGQTSWALPTQAGAVVGKGSKRGVNGEEHCHHPKPALAAGSPASEQHNWELNAGHNRRGPKERLQVSAHGEGVAGCPRLSLG